MISVPAKLYWRTFVDDSDTNHNATHETGLFIVLAKDTHRIDDPIHLPDCYAVHDALQLIKVFLDCFIFQSVFLCKLHA